jgi:hypothetical protein
MELRKPDNYYGACLATEPPLPFGFSDRKGFCKLKYLISNIVNRRYRGVDLLAVAGNSIRSIHRKSFANDNIRFQIL